LTSNDPTSIIEKPPSLNWVYTVATIIETLQRNCRYTVDATVTPGVLQPSTPSRNLVLRFMKEERFIGKQRMVIEPVPWFQRHEGRRDHFLNSQVRIVPNNNENMPTETSFSVGSTLMTTARQKG
jgi:hypothetical protein